MMEKDSRIYVAGHTGMVGSAIVRQLTAGGWSNILTATRNEIDLISQDDVYRLFRDHHIDYVFMAAAKVGGIRANMNKPVEFLLNNLDIQNNIFDECETRHVKKICFVGSSCMYPRDCPQPMKEEYLMTGPLEPTNEGYALAKICGIKMADYYRKEYGMNTICPIPCNLYGTNDHFDPENSHVMSALIKKFVDAVDNDSKEVVVWGTGEARREFLHVDDAAKAMVMLMNTYDSPEPINVGSGYDITISKLAGLIANIVGYTGDIVFDTSMPDGMPRKLLDISKIQAMGFEPSISPAQGMVQMKQQYRSLKNGKV